MANEILAGFRIEDADVLMALRHCDDEVQIVEMAKHIAIECQHCRLTTGLQKRLVTALAVWQSEKDTDR